MSMQNITCRCNVANNLIIRDLLKIGVKFEPRK